MNLGHWQLVIQLPPVLWPRRHLAHRFPSLARDELLRAGIGGLAGRGEQRGGGEEDEEQSSHARSINRIVTRASLLHIAPRGSMAGKFKSLKGQLLLDGGKLAGSWFHRSVVLVCQHDPEGAFGLVLNRPSDGKLGDALVADLPDALKQHTVFVGGPVQSTALSYLLTDTFLPEANVMPGLNLDHSLDDLIELGESFSPTQKLKVFAGYSGWSPGQLDDEMRRGSWLLHPARVEHVFEAEPEKLWRDILRQKGWEYRLLADAPEDLSWN